MGLMFELKVTATGEVRDAEGNLLNTEQVETTRIVSEEELEAIQAEQAKLL